MIKKEFIILLLTLFGVCTLLMTGCAKTDIPDDSTVTATFIYGDTSISETLSNEDGKKIKAILDSKMLYTDSPSCGFSKNISVMIGGEIYCIARDGCGIVRVGEKYISLNNTENKKLREILTSHGFVFPCA
ncbi:MAG: hypothetical protein IKT46_05250 [Clostridia bacterium]|nr:hypothetical protein [Clostridia bacterium]